MGVVYGPISPFKNATFYRDFAKYQTLNHLIGPNITYFNNNGSGSYIGSDGYIKHKGTNLFLNSEDYTATTWTKQNDITLISNIINPPAAFANNYKNKASLITQATSSITYMYNATPISFTDSLKQFTFSIFIKSNTSVVASAGNPLLRVRNNTSGNTLFDANIGWTLTSGRLVPSISSSSSLVYSHIEDYSDGWYRISIGGRINSANIQVRIYPNNTIGTGEIGKGYYIWGAQLVQHARQCEYSANTSEILISPRFTYDPVSKKSLGLLVEQSSINRLAYSDNFNILGWSTNAATITPNTNLTLAPDGTYRASILKETTANNDHLVSTLFSPNFNSIMTYSVYTKAKERSIVRLRMVGSSQFANAYFDLNNGTTANISAGTTATIKDAGNGWYRCSISGIANSISGTAYVYVSNSTSTSSYAGDGTSGVYIWGAQVEVSNFATSYIPNDTGSNITRNAENLYITPISFIQPNFQGTIYSEFNLLTSGDSTTLPRIYAINNQINDDDRISFLIQPSGLNIQALCIASGSTGLAASNSVGINQNIKTILSIFPNDAIFYINGALASSGVPNTSVTLPTGLTHFYIGSSKSGNYLNASIQKIIYSPTRSDNVNLKSYTVV